jgi:hypothetical protein
MYIPIGVLIVLFLINPNLALDLILIGLVIYFWQISLPILLILFLIASFSENK